MRPPGSVGSEPAPAQRLQHAARDIRAGRVEHGVVVGEGHVARASPVVVDVEGRPAAVAWSASPSSQCTRARLAARLLPRRVGGARVLQGQQHHARCRRCRDSTRCRTRSTSRRARASGRFTASRPCAGLPWSAASRAALRMRVRRAQPASPSANAAMAVSHTGEKQGWKKSRPSVVDHQAGRTAAWPRRRSGWSARIAEHIERHDGVHHRRDRWRRARRLWRVRSSIQLLGPLDRTCCGCSSAPSCSQSLNALSRPTEKRPPTEEPAIARERNGSPGLNSSSRLKPAGTGRAGFVELDDGQRNHDGARPRRHLVDQLAGQQHDSGGMEDVPSRGYRPKRLRLILT